MISPEDRSEIIRETRVLTYILTQEQAEQLKLMAKSLDIECSPWGFGKNLLHEDLRDCTSKTNLMLGYLQDDKILATRYPIELKIYYSPNTPYIVRIKLNEILHKLSIDFTDPLGINKQYKNP